MNSQSYHTGIEMRDLKSGDPAYEALNRTILELKSISKEVKCFIVCLSIVPYWN